MEPTILGHPLSERGAVFSWDRSRRYSLWRRIEENYDTDPTKPPMAVLFIGLNPSIANETILDPTVTRCMNYARNWSFAYLLMGNLYSKVSTDPAGVDFTERDEVNAQFLSAMHNFAHLTVVCWGSNADEGVSREALMYLKDKPLYAFAVNKNGSPKHPLYLRGDARVSPYEAQKE
jgi:hypothetical protein